VPISLTGNSDDMEYIEDAIDNMILEFAGD
jgi:hypothetical protein